LERIRLFIRVVTREIRGLIKFLRSSRKEESFEEGMSDSVEWRLLERLFIFSVVAWAYDLKGVVIEFEVALTI